MFPGFKKCGGNQIWGKNLEVHYHAGKSSIYIGKSNISDFLSGAKKTKKKFSSIIKDKGMKLNMKTSLGVKECFERNSG